MIHVVGAGWYGCFIAQHLSTHGIDYIVWEKNKIFSGASGHNQNRLHQGYHYPRSHLTRLQSKRGFDLFVHEFAELIFKIPRNFYVVDKGSLIDFETFRTIFRAEGYDFSDVHDVNIPVSNYDGIIGVNECGICPGRSARYWRERNLRVRENTVVKIYNGALYNGQEKLSNAKDKIIDCTWGAFPELSQDYYVEKFLVLRLLKKREVSFGALTLMDGPFFSIFPEDSSQNYYTLTCVELGKLAEMDGREQVEIVKINLDYVRSVYDGFDDDFEYAGCYVGRKLKPKGNASDSRALCSSVSGNLLTIFSGKIDAVFETKQIVDTFIGA